MFYDPRIGEAITLTGQYIIMRVGDHCNKRFNEFFKTDKVRYTLYMDTDSCRGDSLVYVNDSKIRISDLYDNLSGTPVFTDNFNKQYVNNIDGVFTKSFNTKTQSVENKEIKYVMKHRVKKEMFKITTEDGKSIVVTEDHSVVVKRNNRFISVKPVEIDTDNDIVINI